MKHLLAITDWIKQRIIGCSTKAPLLTVLGLMGCGIIFWGGFNWSMELTNTERFCISCHEMRDNVYAEYQNSIHFANGSGVRATCPDCHVPKEWPSKMLRKIGASNELMHKVLGSINTREKFLNKRLELAQHVWSTMEANDSLECRNCHQFTFMDTPRNKVGVRQAHKKAKQEKITCITCHKGIAHQLPEAFIDSEHARFEKDNIPCSNCHAGLGYEDR